MLARAVRYGILFALLGACGPDENQAQPPLLQGLAVGELGGGRYRLAALADGRDSGVLRVQWQVTRGVLDTPEDLQTELTLPTQAGAYPVRVSVQDAQGGLSQALFVILHDPNGRSELAPATLAAFKRNELRSAQTQVLSLQRSNRGPVPPPFANSGNSGGMRLAGVDIGNDSTTISLDARLQYAGTPVTAGEATATWTALGGSFDQASGLKARWRPAAALGLEAVTLTVAEPGGGQSQAVVRLLIDQGVPRDNWLDFVTVKDGRLFRQTFVGTPSLPPVTVAPAPVTAMSPVGQATGATTTVSPGPSVTAGASPGPSALPSGGISPSPGGSASPTPSGSPSAGTPSPSTSPGNYATPPPSAAPNGQKTPTPGSPTPNPSYTPYDPLATPTPQKTPKPAATSSASAVP
ncbi:MAG: hypothetical protein H7338_09425 [Candidatus Sericytochromatia bacterium]|nr:hypothetical protein [Candidatus Sericytochromatia bacterium]